jgi:membrane fusion protein (multidrug efflux system)
VTPKRTDHAGAIRRSLGALLTAVMVLMSSGCRETPKPTGAAPVPVKVTPVIQRDVPIYREWIGTTVGYVTAQIRPRVSGYLVSQEYREGMPVKSGDLLFRIDPRQYQNALDQARGKLEQSQAQLAQARSQLAQNLSEVEQAKAQVRQAESDLAKAVANQTKTQLEVERYTPLLARGAISQQLLDNTVQNNLANEATVQAERANLDKTRASVERAQAGVDKARADVAAADAAIVQATAARDEAQLNLDWTRVLSPITGVAGIKKADVGDLVGASTVLTTVASIDPIYVQFDLTEQQYLRWREARGLASPGRFRIELILADGRVYAQVGTAEILGLEVSATTGTIPVRASFPNPGNVLRPGQYARVRVAVYVSKGALLVPQSAVRDTQGLLQVGLVGPDDTVSLRTIQAGERVGALWIIERGLEPGQRVILEGLEKVKTGDKVAPTTVPAETASDGATRAGAPAAPPPAAGKSPPK